MEQNEGNEDLTTPNSTIISLKCIFALSLILIAIDVFQLFFIFHLFNDYMQSLPLEVFDQCVKYQKVTDLFFAVFGLLCGISAAFFSIALLSNEELFHGKLFNIFIHFNYNLFGPFLLAICCLGFSYFDKIAFSCKLNDIKVKTVNFSTVLCILFASSMATMVTGLYSIISTINFLTNSIRFTREGSNIIGKIFWTFAMNRNTVQDHDFSFSEVNGSINNAQEPRNLIII